VCTVFLFSVPPIYTIFLIFSRVLTVRTSLYLTAIQSIVLAGFLGVEVWTTAVRVWKSNMSRKTLQNRSLFRPSGKGSLPEALVRLFCALWI